MKVWNLPSYRVFAVLLSWLWNRCTNYNCCSPLKIQTIKNTYIYIYICIHVQERSSLRLFAENVVLVGAEVGGAPELDYTPSLNLQHKKNLPETTIATLLLMIETMHDIIYTMLPQSLGLCCIVVSK